MMSEEVSSVTQGPPASFPVSDGSVPQMLGAESSASMVSVALSSPSEPRSPLTDFVSFSIVDTERRMTETISLKDYYTVFLIETK
jgi:hypothetical protein